MSTGLVVFIDMVNIRSYDWAQVQIQHTRTSTGLVVFIYLVYIRSYDWAQVQNTIRSYSRTQLFTL